MSDGTTKTRGLVGLGGLGLLAALLIGAGVPAEARKGEQQESSGTGSGSGDELVAALVRKSEQKEQEDGFCETTGWPSGSDRDKFVRYLQSAKAGTWKINNFENGNCQYDSRSGDLIAAGMQYSCGSLRHERRQQ